MMNSKHISLLHNNWKIPFNQMNNKTHWNQRGWLSSSFNHCNATRMNVTAPSSWYHLRIWSRDLRKGDCKITMGDFQIFGTGLAVNLKVSSLTSSIGILRVYFFFSRYFCFYLWLSLTFSWNIDVKRSTQIIFKCGSEMLLHCGGWKFK